MPSWLAKLGVLGLSLALSALLFEVAVTFALGEQVKFPRHVVGADFGLRINEPRATYRHKSADVEIWFRINGEGMRADREYAKAKPAGVKRIVSLGDSFTIGYEVELEDTFSSVLERELRSRGYAVEVLNAGVSGYSNAEALLYLERELLDYHPDLVLLSFYGNDLVDNVRTGLFRLEGDRLREGAESYVPAGRLGNFLNTNPLFNWLSERSNAFALVKESATLLVKRGMVQANVENLGAAETGSTSPDDRASQERRLAAAILERMLRVCQERGIPLVIQSIPTELGDGRLAELFPLSEFDVEREGVWFIGMAPLLEPWRDEELLYWKQSHSHWTPYSHAVSGRALADLIVDEGLLD
jgi:hypothetical protein